MKKMKLKPWVENLGIALSSIAIVLMLYMYIVLCYSYGMR